MVFVVGSALSVTAAFAADEGSGRLRGFVFVTEHTLVSTDSPGFVEVPDMSVTAMTWGPVIVRFCGACNTLGVGAVFFDVAVDGVPLRSGGIFGGGIQFAVSPSRLPHCFNWVIPDVEPGAHTFEMLWRTSGGGTGYLQARTLTVEGLVWQRSDW
jgi:hypothetical protein